MKPKSHKSALPIYVFIAAWLLCATLLPLYRLGGLLAAVVISVVCAVGAEGLLEYRRAKNAPPEPEMAVSHGPEVDAIVAQGKTAMDEMRRLRSSIPEPRVQEKIDLLMDVSHKIVQDAIEDPSDVPQIKKFLGYYLPTTIKLLNAYDRMGAQGISGDNLSGSMHSIEEMLDTAIAAYKKQLDSLFADQAMDIETDIEVMNRMLAREGLAGNRDFDITARQGGTGEKN